MRNAWGPGPGPKLLSQPHQFRMRGPLDGAVTAAG